MKRACIATIDAARARIFMYQEQANAGFELPEISTLENVGRRMKDGELFSESRPSLKMHGGLSRATHGGNRSDSGEQGSASDDHRDAHIGEMDARFAKKIVEELGELCRRHKLGRLVLIAAPKMLGVLRSEYEPLKNAVRDLDIEEIDKDLSNLTGPQLHDYLASADIVPPRQRLKMAR